MKAALLLLGAYLVETNLAVAQAPQEVKKLAPVVVTGSLIPTAELVGATPVDIYTSADITKFGSQSVRQFLNTLPSAIGSGNFGEARGNGGDGSAAVSIRGIDGGTLVLINGRRLIANQLFGSGNVDINAIPIGAIERIEVLKDGASALYGADAQAGVINIITKKGYTGTEMYASYGNTTETDVGQQNYYFVTGMSGEKSSIMIGGNYYEANSLFSKDRARPKPFGTSGTGNPGRLRTSNALDPDDIIPSAGLVFNGPPGTTPSIPFDPSEFHNFVNLPPPDGDRFEFALFTPAIRPSERWSIFGEATHDILGERLTFFTEALYSRTLSFNQLAPTPIVFLGQETPTSPNGIVVPASNFYNPFGIDINNINYRSVELGPRTEDNTTDFFRFVAGFRGEIADTGWRWEAAVLYNEDSRVQKQGGELNRLALEAAVNDTGSLAFNPFGNRANTRAQLERVAQTLIQTSKSTLAGIDAQVGGKLFDLPSGTVDGVFGGSHYEERAEFDVDFPTRTDQTVGFNQANPFSASRDYDSVFAEVRFPITGKDFKVSGLHSLEVTGAGRFDDYSDFGSTENPKVTFRYQPFNEPLIIRGSYGQSFVPPSFQSLNFMGQSFPELLNPFSGDFEQPTGGTTIFGNPDLKPEEGESWTVGMVWSPSSIKGLTFSVEYYRLEIQDRIANNTQFIIDENFRTGGNDPADPIVNGLFADLIRFNVPVPGDPFNATSPLQYLNVDSPFLNLGAVETDGLDFAVTYEIPTDAMGTFTWSANWTYVLTFDRQTLPGEPFDDVLGDFIPAEVDAFGFGTVPRHRGNMSIFWNYKWFEFGVTGNYIHGVRDYRLALDDPDTPEVENRDINSIITVDLQASCNLPYDTRVTVGVLNINDEEPPKAVGAFADNYDRDLHDLRQRFVYFSIHKKF